MDAEVPQGSTDTIEKRLLVISAVISALILLAGYLAIQDHVQGQKYNARQAIMSSEERIRKYLNGRRERMRLLAYSHMPEVLALIRNPGDEASYENLGEHVRRYIPRHLAYTIGDPSGERLYYDDLGEQIGELCRDDIHRYAQGNYTQDIYIHPGPNIFHFDLMESVRDDAGAVIGVFYVSIDPEELQQILASEQPEGQHLYLLRTDTEGLIEVGARGARDIIGRETQLTAEELSSGLSPRELDHTRWRLISLPDPDIFAAKVRRISYVTALAVIAVLLITAIAVWRLKRADIDLRRSQDMFQSLVITMDGVVWRAHAIPFSFTYISPQLRTLFGYNPDDWLKDPDKWFAAMHPEDRDQIISALAPREPGKSGDMEFRLRLPQGGEVWLRALVHSRVLPDGEQTLTGFMTDVSRHHHDQNILREQTRELQLYTEELESFSYSVSHDLRSPLRAINGYSQMIAEDYGAQLDEQGKDILGRIQAAAVNMGSLIDALLELSRVARTAIEPKPIDLSQIVEKVRDGLHEIDPDRKVTWQIQPAIRVYADPVLMRVALQNLLDNAWKFTRKRQDACIQVSAHEHGGMVEVKVSDNGAGCDMKFADMLFKPFQRLHQDHEYEGTGIGLATVKRVIDRHQGEIHASCAPDKGASIYFSLLAANK